MRRLNLRHWSPFFLLGALVLTISLACRIPGQSTPVQPVITIVAPTSVVVELPQPVTSSSSEEESLETLYNTVNPAVVNITIYQKQDSQVVPVSQGSGFVCDLAQEGGCLEHRRAVCWLLLLLQQRRRQSE